MKHFTLLNFTFTLGLAQTLSAASLITGGHIDVPAFGYDSAGGFEPHFHNEGGPDGVIIDGVREENETEYEADELTVYVNPISTTTLGMNSYYWLPETETAAAANNVPFVGIGLEELNLADWVGGTVTLTLLSATGPGEFRLWQDDGFGGTIDYIDTLNSVTSFSIIPGSHTHYNWGFTQLGIYNLEFEISGVHVADGVQSASATFSYAIPEPSSAILGLSGLLLVFHRRR
jgi:surface-anchored protein